MVDGRMLNLDCPTCGAKCSVDEAAAARKFKCPKCAARMRRHPDGVLELLTPGTKPPEPPAPVPAAAPSPEGPPAPVESPSRTGVLGTFAKQDESKQNEIVLWSVGGVLTLTLSGTGLLLGAPILAVAPMAIGFTAALVVLYLRARRRAFEAARQALASGKASTGNDATDLLPKVK
jgi:hypothetical protein